MSSRCPGGLEIGTQRDIRAKITSTLQPHPAFSVDHLLPTCQCAACPRHGCAFISSARAHCSPASGHTLRHLPQGPFISPGYIPEQSRFGVTGASTAMLRLSPRCDSKTCTHCRASRSLPLPVLDPWSLACAPTLPRSALYQTAWLPLAGVVLRALGESPHKRRLCPVRLLLAEPRTEVTPCSPRKQE